MTQATALIVAGDDQIMDPKSAARILLPVNRILDDVEAAMGLRPGARRKGMTMKVLESLESSPEQKPHRRTFSRKSPWTSKRRGRLTLWRFGRADATELTLQARNPDRAKKMKYCTSPQLDDGSDIDRASLIMEPAMRSQDSKDQSLAESIPNRKRKYQDDSQGLLELVGKFTDKQPAKPAQMTAAEVDGDRPATEPDQMNISVRLSSPELNQEEQRQAHSLAWHRHPSLQNPPWVDKRLTASLTSIPTSMFATIDVFKLRPLVRALQEQSIELIERGGQMQGAHLSVSPLSAFYFANIADLLTHQDRHLKALKKASHFYPRVCLICEVSSYGEMEQRKKEHGHGNTEPAQYDNPVNAEQMAHLPMFKRGLSLMCSGSGTIRGAQTEAIFALNGGADIAKLVRSVMEEDFGRINRAAGKVILEAGLPHEPVRL